MVQYSPDAESGDDLSEQAQLEFAVRAISGDPHLRFFVRTYLAYCHVAPPSSVFDVNPYQSAFNQGVQAAGMEFAAMLTAVEPRLVPALMLEELTPDV